MEESKGLSISVPLNKGMLDLMNKSSHALIKHQPYYSSIYIWA